VSARRGGRTPVFGKLLIANRGEIACRIMATAARLGVSTVAVYSDADRDALHARSADEAHRIGRPAAAESYLDVAAIIAAMRASGADAVHPGYGFLAESAELAEACAACGVAFVGPPAAVIRALGDKAAARTLVSRAGVPVLPGYDGDEQSPGRLRAEAERLGFPLVVKPAAGGGGKGLHVVRSAEALASVLETARREARAAFADDRLILERHLAPARHLEVQILADHEGRVLHLFERDCSLQRRRQKVVEEAPAPGVDAALRERLADGALVAARAAGYVGAGTVEFLCAPDGHCYFLEMNTRLQVEHPVTEAVTGLDLVEWQLRIAAGEPLPLAQAAVSVTGHAIEARVYAEDPRRGFLPASGRIAALRLPGEVRVDAGVQSGDAVGIHYDPLLAKLIAHGPDRAAAAARLRHALAATQVLGVTTNLAFLEGLLAHPCFAAGGVDTEFLERALPELTPPPVRAPDAALATALLEVLDERAARSQRELPSPWRLGDAWRLNETPGEALCLVDATGERKLTVRHRRRGRTLAIDAGAEQPLEDEGASGERRLLTLGGRRLAVRVLRAGQHIEVVLADGRYGLTLAPLASAAARAPVAAGRLTAPMPGRVVAVHARPGDTVRRGEALVVLEAMKMEHTVGAPEDGIVREVRCRVGDLIEADVELLALDPSHNSSFVTRNS